MKLRLPTTKKERIQVLAVVVIGVVGVGFLLMNLGIKPYMKQRKKLEKDYVDLQQRIERIRKALETSGDVESRRAEVLAEIERITSAYIPEPEFGINYIIGIRKRMTRHATTANVKLEPASVEQLRIDPLPVPSRAAPARAFKAYLADVKLECDYADLLRLIEALERANPYASVASIRIIAQPEIPEKHEIRLALMWPIWAKPRTQDEGEETGSEG